MSCKIRFTDTAKEDLRKIAVYIAEQTKDKSVAVRFVNALRDRTKILEQFPESGSSPDDRVLKSMGYRFLVHGDYLIFYRYEPQHKTSYILAVFHSGRDYTRLMRRFLNEI